MRKYFVLYLVFIYCGFPLTANDSILRNNPYFVTFNTTDGLVFPTNDFVSGENRIPHYTSFALKFRISSKGDHWKDHAYGMPYMGIGIYTANFSRDKDLGRPFSVFSFRGRNSSNSRLIFPCTMNSTWEALSTGSIMIRLITRIISH